MVIEDRGAFQLPGQEREYRDWSWTKDNSGGQGMVDLRRAIYRSSNVYFYDLASRIPVQDLVDFAAQFGLGRDMSVDIPAAGWGLLLYQSGSKALRDCLGFQAIQSIWVLVRVICWPLHCRWRLLQRLSLTGVAWCSQE